MRFNSFQRFSLIALAGIILFISFLVIRPLITSILSGAILAYFFHPVYVFLERSCPWHSCNTRRFSALFVIVTIICFILLPLSLFISLLVRNLPNIKELISSGIPLAVERINSFLSASPLSKQVFSQYLNIDISSIFSAGTDLVFRHVQDLAASFPQLIFGAFLTLYITYYMIRNADNILKFLHSIIPFSKKQTGHILDKFNGLARGMILSQFIIALIQGILMTIGCIILQLPYSLLIGLITVILAIIPFMGAVIVWMTVSLFLFMIKAPMWQLFFMICYGSLLVSSVDNFVRPKILSDASQINPAVVLVGFIGGFLLFGLPGIILGPFILALLELAFEIFKELA
jgi:predicted PurR-regulated permease PerM